VAIADLDGDGRLDLAINNNNRQPTLYFNEFAREGSWLTLKLVGSQSNRSAIGAQVRLRVGDKVMTRQVEAGSGFSAQAMLPVHFGLGPNRVIDEITITWPSGQEQHFDGVHWATTYGLNRLVHITEGAALTALDAPTASEPGQIE